MSAPRFRPRRGLKTADGGSVGAGSVEWKFADLGAGDQKALKLTAEALQLADKAALSVAVVADATSGARTVGDPVQAKADSVIAIIGTPGLVLELATPPGPIEVGKKVTFTARIRNDGTVSARNVEVTAYSPPELRPTPGTGAGSPRLDAGGKVTFPPVDEIRPGQTLAFTVEVEAVQAGDARFRAEIKAAHLTKPLVEEQSARVTGK